MANKGQKRKDKDRIVLRTGESQRPNGTYDYRWTGRDGKRHVVYAKTLEELRKKEEQVQNAEGKTETKEYCYMLFKDTAGMYDFRLEVANSASYESLAKYFDKLFGIQKTLGNSVRNAKRQINAIKSFVGAARAAVDGTLDEKQAAETAGVLDTAVYGDRTEWIAKADAALAAFHNEH